MAINLHANAVITPALRDGMPSSGPISGMTLSNNEGGFTEVIDFGGYTEAIAFILTSGKSGSPTLDCDVQYSPDGKNFVDSGDSFTQITANGLNFKKLSSNFGKFVRFRIKLVSGGSYVATMGVAVKG